MASAIPPLCSISSPPVNQYGEHRDHRAGASKFTGKLHKEKDSPTPGADGRKRRPPFLPTSRPRASFAAARRSTLMRPQAEEHRQRARTDEEDRSDRTPSKVAKTRSKARFIAGHPRVMPPDHRARSPPARLRPLHRSLKGRRYKRRAPCLTTPRPARWVWIATPIARTSVSPLVILILLV